MIKEDQVIWYDIGGIGNNFYRVLAYQLNYQKNCLFYCTEQALRNIVAEQVKRHWHYYKHVTFCNKIQYISDNNLIFEYIIGIRMGTVFIKSIESLAAADAFNLNLLIKYQVIDNHITGEIYRAHLPSTGYKRKTVAIGYNLQSQKYKLLVKKSILSLEPNNNGLFLDLGSSLYNLGINFNKTIHAIKIFFAPGAELNQAERLASKYSELFDKIGKLGRIFFRTLLKLNLSPEQQITKLLKFIKQLVLEQKIKFRLAEEVYRLVAIKVFCEQTDVNTLQKLQNYLQQAVYRANQLRSEDQAPILLRKKDLRLFDIMYWYKIRATISQRWNKCNIEHLEAKRKLLHFMFKYEELSQGKTLSPDKPFTYQYMDLQLNKIRRSIKYHKPLTS